jgi:hypothetical protein
VPAQLWYKQQHSAPLELGTHYFVHPTSRSPEGMQGN